MQQHDSDTAPELPPISPKFTHTQRVLRVAGFLLGAIIVFWLPFENKPINQMFIVGLLVSVWISLYWLASRQDRSLRIFILGGVLLGVLTPILTAALMLLQIGIHSHGGLDFSTGQIFSVLLTIPLWALGGLMLGMSTGLYFLARRI